MVRAAGRAGLGNTTDTATASGGPRPGRERTVTVAYTGGEERRGPVTMGQANMIRCILRDEPLHINNHDVWPVPAGTATEQVLDALRALVVRHEALRTTFPEPATNASRTQVVAAEGNFTVRLLDHDEFGADPAHYAETVARRARAGRFRLDRDFPLRIALLSLRGAPAFVALSSSHAVTDGSALAVLHEEWLALLGGAGLPPVTALTPLDLAAEEATPAGLRRSEASLRYWKQIIGTGPQEMFAEPRAARTDGQQPQLTLRSLRGARALAQAAKRTGSPSPTVLLTAWCTLVAHRAGQSTCVAAAPLSNRSRPGLARSVNTLSQDALLSLDVRGPSFDAVLRKAWGAALGAYRHSQFDSVRLWEAIDETTFERGSHFARDVVFNDVSGLTDARESAQGRHTRLTGHAPDAEQDVELDLEWGPLQVLPTRLLCFAYRTRPLLHLGMWADPALFTREEAETFLTGLVKLLEVVAYEDVPLASLTEATGVRPAERGGDWLRVDGCWTSPAAVADALSGALGGLPVHVATDDGSAPAPGGEHMTAFIASGGAPLTPDGAHTALMETISGPGPSGLLAPVRYVIVHDPPAAQGDSSAWLRQRILMEGNGRPRPTRDDH
ncbi:condensation domain-containing protein [Streptomyces sp. NPDC057900]|uniref:condensation domain-containing protein n=1 Tax=Streptomyces sp. NPDC057900 TaxID=3346274 RepID=UPI0036EC3A8A